MPPYDDITQTGPQNWRELQKQNSPSIPDEYWNLSDRERMSFRRNYLKNLSPKVSLTENELPKDFGKSKYDTDVPSYALNDLEDWRARQQSGFGQIANGIIKGAITTGTTYVDLLAGIPAGIITAVAEGRLSGLWDNVVTNAMKDVTDWSEEALPNYYTNTQRESAWYNPSNLFSANFLGDKLIKNFGFSAGAGLGMKTISKIPKLLPRLAKDQKIARSINTAETSFAGAVGEGSIEALNGTKEWAEQNRSAIESERSQALAGIDLKYTALKDALMSEYGNTEVGIKLMQSLINDYNSEVNNTNYKYDSRVKQLQDQIDDQGNLILAGNIPILWGSNILTLGKMIARGYGAAEDASSKFIRRKAVGDAGRGLYESTLTSARQAARYAKTPILEGFEEMNQAVISNAAKDRAQDYYNMSIDPDATDATKSYMGYLWDAFGKTYGDINNYEEFVIGMLSSGISDIVVGQGKALKEERKNINDAVNRANDVINNFDNRMILQNMNRQQVLEDQKLEAAFKNDKKSFKDSEFGQIASAVVAFSQIGKIEDLKAMLDENLSGLTDAELDNLADELQPEGTQEPNFFKAMTYEQRRDYLSNQKKAYEKTIDDYNKVREEIIEQSGSLFSPEQQAELIFYRLRANNAQDRINSMLKDSQEQILHNTTWNYNTLKKIGLNENRIYSKQEVADAVANIDNYKLLAEIFHGQPIEKLFLDIDALQKDVKKYNDTVLDFIANPQKLEEKNNWIKRKVLNGINAVKIKKIVPKFNNIKTFTEFSKELSNVDKKLQNKVLDELIKQGHREAKQFKDKTNFSKYALKFLSESDESEDIIVRASDLISKVIDKESVEYASDLNNPLYSRENNNDLSDSEYQSLFNLIGDVVKHSIKEAAEPITKESPIEKNEEKKSKDNESSKETFKRVIDESAGEVEDYEGEENVLEDDEPRKESSLTKDTDNNSSLNGTEQINTRILGTPLASDQCHDTTKDINTTEESKIKDEKTQPGKDVVTLGFSDIDTKATIINEKGEEVKNPYVGIPVIDQMDKDGNPTKAAIELTPLYNRLKELGAFDNINNGVVKIGSQIKFAIDPTLKREHNVNGNIVNYTESPVLLYVGDKCVGSLTNATANRIGIRQKLEEEFANSSNDSIHISNRYYMLADEIWAGRIKFEKHSSVITNEKLNSIKERMSNSTLNADEVVPIITIFDPNANAFVQGTTEEYRLGRQVSNIFDDMFYKGSVVLLVPTGAYNSQSAIQPNHAFMPVRLENIRVKDISKDSKTRKELRSLIEKIFVKDQTQGGLNSIISDIKKLITYNYHVSPTENIEVHIDPCTPRRDDNGNIIYYPNGIAEVTPITNHSYFSTHNINPNDGKFTYIRIRYKIGNNDVREFICPTHNGNVLNTSAFTSERIKEQADAIERVFIEDLNSFVNIDKNQLVNGDYIQKLIDDKILRTNVEDFKVYGNSFSMDGIIHDSQETSVQTEETQSEQTSQESQQENTGLEMMPVTEEDLGMFRKESLRTTSNIIDIDKEVDLIIKMLPQLNREKAFEIVKTLIDINGTDEKAMGQFFRGVIKLSELAESGTAYHEAYHLVFNMILKPKERKSLLKEYSKRYPKLSEIELEEQMAEDFRDYAMTREDIGVEKGIVAWFKRLADLVKAIFNGRYYFESVASKIWRSKYSHRELVPTDNIRNKISSIEDSINAIQSIFEKRSQPDRGFDIGTYTATSNGKPVTKTNSIKELIVKEKGQYFLNMGVKFDKYNPNLSNSEKKVYTTSFIAGRSPLEVFNSITKNIGINNLLLIKHDTNYVDKNGNPVYRYEIVGTTPFGTMYEVDKLPLSSLKEEYTKTPEELYEDQSDPLDKIKQCDY